MNYKIFRNLNLLFGLLILSSICFGQHSKNQIKGVVTDSLTNEPVPYANVYFANTSIGTSTNETGEYSLAGFADGKYDLTISSVGFKLTQYPLEFSGTTYNFSVMLPPEVKTLSSILVKPDTANWQNNFNDFKKYFVGLTRNAFKVEIKNKRDIHLFFDDKTSTLYGHCKVPIEIENSSLGYRLRYQLVNFYVDYKNGTMQYAGLPLFESLVPRNKRETAKWEKERKKSYKGSFTHFLQTLYRDEIELSGFKIVEIHEVRNKKKPSESFLKERIAYWKKRQTVNGTFLVRKNDSLAYYSELFRQPEFVDSIGKEIKNARDIITFGKEVYVSKKGKFKVTFDEREEEVYAAGLRRATKGKQESLIYFLEDKTRIYTNGYFEPISNVFLSGYLGWSEKIAELLPLDYIYKK
ncbi:MAG: carboxypeptidase-like regulatory domain-containing protein [Chryseotalea sp.]